MRAHSHHRLLRLGCVAAAPLLGELLAHLVPEVLGVDQHAVHVEDDGLDLRRPRSPADRTEIGAARSRVSVTAFGRADARTHSIGALGEKSRPGFFTPARWAVVAVAATLMLVVVADSPATFPYRLDTGAPDSACSHALLAVADVVQPDDDRGDQRKPRGSTLDPGKDYIIEMPPTPVTAEGGVWLTGGLEHRHGRRRDLR